MNPPSAHPPGADDPIDDVDLDLLEALADLYADLDPPPADLVDRVRFAAALEHLDAEVFRMREEHGLDPALARSGEEHSRTVTFESSSLTVMVTMTEAPEGGTRFDGWCAPPAAHVVELRTVGGPLVAEADDQGRFVFRRVPPGLAQLVVRLAAPTNRSGATSVITPAMQI